RPDRDDQPEVICRSFSLGRAFLRSLLMRGEVVALTVQHDMAVVKCLERAAMTDRDRGRRLELVGKQAIERRLGGLVERSGGLVEEKVLRLGQQRAGDAETLLF